MIYLNKWPLFCLTASVGSAYYGVKMAATAVPKLLRLPFGSNSVSERVDRAVKDTLDGSLSVQDVLFGSENKKERFCELISGSIFLVKSVSLIFLSYLLYNESKKSYPIQQGQFDKCHLELNLFKGEVDLARQKATYWEQSLCQFDKQQWEKYTGEVEFCDGANSISYPQIKEGCRETFAELTFKSYMQDILPRSQVTDATRALKNKQNQVMSFCRDILLKTESLVNEKCSYLHPYVGLKARSICKFVRNVPFVEVSSDCLQGCDIDEVNNREIYDQIYTTLPKTKDTVLNCPEILEQPNIVPQEVQEYGKPILSEEDVLRNIQWIQREGGEDLRNTSYNLEPKRTFDRHGHPRAMTLANNTENHEMMTWLRNVLQDVRAKIDFKKFMDTYTSKGYFNKEWVDEISELNKKIVR